VIEYKDDRSVARDVFEAGDFDALEVDSERQPQDRNYKISNHFPLNRADLSA
jgi:hypothetical protein